jgi:toxin YoeB
LKAENKNLANKLWELIFDVLENLTNPLQGIGKPEALKGDMSRYYSRRITEKHRLIYKIEMVFQN